MLRAIQRGPIVVGRALERPSAREFTIMLLVCAAAMTGLYAGLNGRNAALAATGVPVFAPRVALDDAIAFMPTFVIAYYAYFPLLFFFSVLTLRDRRVMYEGVVGYVATAALGFVFFWLLPSRMAQPDISACATTSCRMLDAMFRLDDGFNIFPSMHVAYATLVWLFFRRYMPELTRAVGVVVFAIIASTLLCKRHYVVDVPAGVALAVAVFALARALGGRLARALRCVGPAPRASA